MAALPHWRPRYPYLQIRPFASLKRYQNVQSVPIVLNLKCYLCFDWAPPAYNRQSQFRDFLLPTSLQKRINVLQKTNATNNITRWHTACMNHTGIYVERP